MLDARKMSVYDWTIRFLGGAEVQLGMGGQVNDIEVVGHIAEMCATSRTASELARRLVHSEIVGQDAIGSVFYLITQAGDLEPVGSFGKTPLLGDDVSIWADNPIAKTVSDLGPHSALMEVTGGEQGLVACIPILKGSDPIGVAVIVRTEAGIPISSTLGPNAIRSIANTYGIWIDALGLKPSGTSPVDMGHSQEDLTTRQLEVLKDMANGKTNAQIAADMILSESSIRQETVRIYRALGVGTRAEAARKALNLGLIEKVSI